MKYCIFLFLAFTGLLLSDIKVYQYSGVAVNHNGKKVTLEREIDPKCLDISISSEQIWEGVYAAKEVPPECKAVFVTSVGQIQPISIHPDIETYGEMEVMHFFKEMQQDDSMILVDTRDKTWFDFRTIPGAVNMPHHDIVEADHFPEDFKRALMMMGIKKSKEGYDFSAAKTIVFFCNGAWCSQSPVMIKKLMTLGYPPQKMKWYRGGMHDWLTLSMTSTHKKED